MKDSVKAAHMEDRSAIIEQLTYDLRLRVCKRSLDIRCGAESKLASKESIQDLILALREELLNLSKEVI